MDTETKLIDIQLDSEQLTTIVYLAVTAFEHKLKLDELEEIVEKTVPEIKEIAMNSITGAFSDIFEQISAGKETFNPQDN